MRILWFSGRSLSVSFSLSPPFLFLSPFLSVSPPSHLPSLFLSLYLSLSLFNNGLSDRLCIGIYTYIKVSRCQVRWVFVDVFIRCNKNNFWHVDYIKLWLKQILLSPLHIMILFVWNVEWTWGLIYIYIYLTNYFQSEYRLILAYLDVGGGRELWVCFCWELFSFFFFSLSLSLTHNYSKYFS